MKNSIPMQVLQARSVSGPNMFAVLCFTALIPCTSLIATAQSPRDNRSQIRDPIAVLRYVNDSPIAAQSDGIIMSIEADEGDFVPAGTLLVALDSRLAHAELKVAGKELEASLEKANDKSNIEFQDKSLQVANTMLKKFQDLLKTGAASSMDLEIKRLEAEKARLGGQVARVENNTAILQSGVAQAKKEAAAVQIELREIKAPFDGVVAERKKQTFEFVRLGEPILRFVGMESLYVIGEISTKELAGPPHLLEGANATAIISLFNAAGGSAAQEMAIQGKLDFVSPTVTPNDTYRVKMKIANTQENGKWLLREGMSCTLVVDAPSRPQSAAVIPGSRK